MSGLSGEDRKRLRGLANQPSVNNAQARAIHSALTLIDQQEKALEAARDGLQRIADHDWTEPPADMPDEMAREALARVDSARTTSTKEAG